MTRTIAIGSAIAAPVLWVVPLLAFYKLDVNWLAYYERMVAHGHSVPIIAYISASFFTLLPLVCLGLVATSIVLSLRNRSYAALAISMPLIGLAAYLLLTLAL